MKQKEPTYTNNNSGQSPIKVPSNTPTPPVDGLREQIKDIIAPNAHIDHQNIRPDSVSYTEIGVEYAAEKLEQLFNTYVLAELKQFDHHPEIGRRIAILEYKSGGNK